MGNGILDTTFAELFREYMLRFGDPAKHGTVTVVAAKLGAKREAISPLKNAMRRKRKLAAKYPSLAQLDKWIEAGGIDAELATQWRCSLLLDKARVSKQDPGQAAVIEDLIRKAGL